jgi:hypothetical protein
MPSEVHFGIDVSSYQKGVDWSKAFSSGVEFALVKCTEGSTFTDPRADSNLNALAASGRVFGGYHFLHHSTSGAQQAWHFRTVLSGGSGNVEGRLAALDVEQAGAWARGPEFIWTWNELTDGHPLLLYSNSGLWRLSGGDNALAGWSTVHGWHAGIANGTYVSGHGTLGGIWALGQPRLSLFGGLLSFPMIQFTDRATVPGVTTPVDGNVWLGTMAQLRRLTSSRPAHIATGDTEMMLIHVLIGPGEERYYLLWGNGDRLGYSWLSDVVANAVRNGGMQVGMTLSAADFTRLCGEVATGGRSSAIDPQELAAALAEALPGGLPDVDVQALAQAVATALQVPTAQQIAAEVSSTAGRRLLDGPGPS